MEPGAPAGPVAPRLRLRERGNAAVLIFLLILLRGVVELTGVEGLGALARSVLSKQGLTYLLNLIVLDYY